MSKTRKFLTILTMVAVTTTASLTAVASAQARSLTPAEAAALGAFGGFVAGAVIASPRRGPVVYAHPAGGSRAHVNWCLRRYRSYNIYTDTFTGFDGRQHYCNSPYIY